MKRLFILAIIASAGAAHAQINFSDNHDTGSTFTASLGGGANPWALTTNGANAFSANNYWKFTDISTISDSFLTSPTLTYTATTTGPVTLSFWHKLNLESTFDGGVVELQVNGGAFTNIGQAAWTLNGYNATISSSFGSAIGGQRAFSGSSAGWTTADSTTNWINSIATLGTFNVGDTFAIRFHGATDSSVAATGWFVDDVNMTAAAAVPEPASMAALGLGALALLRKRRKA